MLVTKSKIMELRFLAVFLICSLIACQNESTTQQQSETPSTAPQARGGAYETPKPQPENQTVAHLTEGVWVIEGYMAIGEEGANETNRGRWFEFNKDGNLKTGRWDEESATGSWAIEPTNLVLKIDSQNDVEDSEFTVKMTASGNTMVWVGTPTFNQNNVQCKLIKLSDRPTEAQFDQM